MTAFETTAIMEDERHLTLVQPLPSAFKGACRVIVLSSLEKEPSPSRWPAGFLSEIHISDPAFIRPDQGLLPVITPLDA